MRASIPFQHDDVVLLRPWGDSIQCTVNGALYTGSRPTVESIAREEERLAEATRRLARAKSIRAALDAYDVALAREITAERAR